jgi:hypothetical protein
VLAHSVVHQSAAGWEIIDSSNSNLPSFGSTGKLEDHPVVKDDSGKIWIQLDTSVATTSDGRHWTVFDKTSLGMRSGRLIRVFERRGTVVVAGFSGCSGTECSGLIRCVRNGSGWRIDTLRLPFTVPDNGTYFEDAYGDVWLSVIREARPVIYRYTGSSWTRCDTAAIPFRLAALIGESPDGTLYFEDTANETVVLDRGKAAEATLEAAHSAPAAVSVHAVGVNGLRAEFSLRCASLVQFSLFSPSGRLVRRLLTEWCGPGRHCRTFTVKTAPGIYIAGIRTGEGSAVSRVVRQ